MPSPCSFLTTRWNRLRGKEGAIRLLLDDEDEKGEQAGLPFFLSGEEAEREGYTSAHLLFECILASLWNASCLLYLLRPSSSSSSPSSPSPSRTFILALLTLIAIPLFIGVSAGAAALWGGSRVDVERREKVGRLTKGLTWVGFVACVAAAYPILLYVIEGQNSLLQGHLTVRLALIQVVLVKAGCDTLSDSNDDEEAEEGSIALPPAYSPSASLDEKSLLTAREFLLEQHFSSASAKAKRVLGIEEDKEEGEKEGMVEVKVEVVPEERGGRLLLHSFAA